MNDSNTLLIDKSNKEAVFKAIIPENAEPGKEFQISVESFIIRCQCPENWHPGQSVEIKLPLVEASSTPHAAPSIGQISHLVEVPNGVTVGVPFPVNIYGHLPFFAIPSDEKFVYVVPPYRDTPFSPNDSLADVDSPEANVKSVTYLSLKRRRNDTPQDDVQRRVGLGSTMENENGSKGKTAEATAAARSNSAENKLANSIYIDSNSNTAVFRISIPEYVTPGNEFEIHAGPFVLKGIRPLNSTRSQIFQIRLPIVAAKPREPGDWKNSISLPPGVRSGMIFPVEIDSYLPFMASCPPTAFRVYSVKVLPPDCQLREKRENVFITSIKVLNNDKKESCFESDEDKDRVQNLPMLASTALGEEFDLYDNMSKTILAEVRNKESRLSALRGKEEFVLASIVSFLATKWANRVTLTLPASAIEDEGMAIYGKISHFCENKRNEANRHDYEYDDDYSCEDSEYSDSSRLCPETNHRFVSRDRDESMQGVVSYVSLTTLILFPKPMDRNVNMMPFVIGNEVSLPKELRCYHDLIEQCPFEKDEIGKVCYLTVHESYVEASSAQRREGLHVETPGTFSDENSSVFVPSTIYAWGRGYFYGREKLEGGIFMASTVADTSEVWDALVDTSVEGIVDRHGGCEHLRKLLGPGKKLRANELIWMTDCTPHQALPQKESGYRQFFRVVTSKISHWFADHSTPNPFVPLPDNVVVVHGSKFDDVGV